MSMTSLNSRRKFLVGVSALSLTACLGAPDYSVLDAESIQTRSNLFGRYPAAKKAADDAAGYIVFPSVKKAGFIVGGSTGRGTLFSKNNVIGHYSVNGVSWGLQAGAQEFSMILFFMTPEAMANFRSGRGIEVGTDIEYALPKYGSLSIGASSATYQKPVYALIFNQEGIMVGASLKGAKYDSI